MCVCCDEEEEKKKKGKGRDGGFYILSDQKKKVDRLEQGCIYAKGERFQLNDKGSSYK